MRKRGRRAAAPESSSYVDERDLPPVIEEVEKVVQSDSEFLEISFTRRDLKKREKKAHAASISRKEVVKDDGRDDFSVAIGTRATAVQDDVKDISIDSFSVAARGIELLKNASVKICHGKRYGLVGPNGMGKSTLLKLLSWRQIPVPQNIDLLFVEQEVAGDDRTALEAVVSAHEELMRLRAEVDSLSNNFGDDDGTGKRLAELYDQLEFLGSDAAESQASRILAGLGFTEDMQARPTNSFSGGWRMRISLARALFVQPTLLLLDEPTNHLDLRAVLWLEEYLCIWKKTLVVVSHNRDFLNTVCTDFIHLHDLKLHYYRGNFDAFESGYESKRTEVNKKFDKYTKAYKYGNRTQIDKFKHISAKEASKKRGEGKEDEIFEEPKKWMDYMVKFHFPQPTDLKPPPSLQLKDVSYSYPNREDFRLSDVDVTIDMGTRVAIVGPNGAGKSTLLNLLAGDLAPNDGDGEVRKTEKLRIGRYSQHFVDQLTMDETPVDYLLRLHLNQKGSAYEVSRQLFEFGLPKKNYLTKISKLSGGQKARVIFTSISMLKPHILLLDEPTNHLDMQSIDALADALGAFTGGVVLVSHDSRLISRVCHDEERSEIWLVENGTVETFPGSFKAYKEGLLKEIRTEVDD